MLPNRDTTPFLTLWAFDYNETCYVTWWVPSYTSKVVMWKVSAQSDDCEQSSGTSSLTPSYLYHHAKNHPREVLIGNLSPPKWGIYPFICQATWFEQVYCESHQQKHLSSCSKVKGGLAKKTPAPSCLLPGPLFRAQFNVHSQESMSCTAGDISNQSMSNHSKKSTSLLSLQSMKVSEKTEATQETLQSLLQIC